MDDRVNDAAGADYVGDHGNHEPYDRLKHQDTDISQNNQGGSEDGEEGDVLNKDSCEWESNLNVAAQSLVEELKNLVRVIDLVLSHEPLILLLIELLRIVPL